MAKEVAGLIKLQIRGGAANPAPPVGPALGAKGVNIMEFCKQFNARTQDKAGKVLPAVITVYSDKSFDFVIKTPPAAVQILEKTKLKKGSSEPNRSKVGTISWDKVREIAEDKLPTAKDVIRSDLDARDLYRNQLQTSLDDSVAEYIYQKKNENFESPEELVSLLKDAQRAIDKWFGFIPDDDIKEALEMVRKEQIS